MSKSSHVLTTQCADQPGISGALMTAIFEAGGNIVDAQQFNDPIASRFFSRTVFDIDARAEQDLNGKLAPVLERFGITSKLSNRDYRPKVLIMASGFDHCLGELLYRWTSGDLKMDVVGIAANYPQSTYQHVMTTDLPFHYVPITPQTKPQQEEHLLRIIEESGAELVILARYMQILSDHMAKRLDGRCINIHHSFLPGFKGAKPYHQAYDRGVKIIGATSHYVTADLDEGPIIEQEIERISHRDSPEDLVRRGRELERRVLARAVRFHLEDRVIRHGHRTVVFAD